MSKSYSLSNFHNLFSICFLNFNSLEHENIFLITFYNMKIHFWTIFFFSFFHIVHIISYFLFFFYSQFFCHINEFLIFFRVLCIFFKKPTEYSAGKSFVLINHFLLKSGKCLSIIYFSCKMTDEIFQTGNYLLIL